MISERLLNILEETVEPAQILIKTDGAQVFKIESDGYFNSCSQL